MQNKQIYKLKESIVCNISFTINHWLKSKKVIYYYLLQNKWKKIIFAKYI